MALTEKRTEDDVIKSAQNHFAGLKADLVCLQKINKDAGRLEASSACMGLHGLTQDLHAKATEKLYKYYPGYADEIVARGGGGR